MKNLFPKACSFILNPKTIPWLVVISLLSSKELSTLINDLMLKFSPFFLYVDHSTFYSESFNGLVYSALGVVSAIVIPMFISIYESLKSGDSISEHFIKDNFNKRDVRYLLFWIFLGVLSRNSIFLFVMFAFATVLLSYRVKIYFDFLYRADSTLINYIKSVIVNAKTYEEKFSKLSGKIEDSIKKVVSPEEGYTPELLRITFSSSNNVVGFNEGRLSQFLNSVKDYLVTQNRAVFGLKDQPEKPAEKAKLYFYLFTGAVTRSVSLTFVFGPKDNADCEQLQNDARNKFQELYNEVFSYDDTEKSRNLNSLFDNLDAYVLSLIKQGKLADFKNYINLLKEILDQDDLKNSELMTKISILNYRLFVLGKEEAQTRFISNIFFGYWEKFLHVTTKYPQEDFIKGALSDLSNGIQNGFFLPEEIEQLDKKITDFYKYNKFENKFVVSYIKGLISVSLSLYKKEEPSLSLKVIQFISYLENDFSSRRERLLKKYSDEEIASILLSSRQALIMTAFHYANERKAQDAFCVSIYNFISQEFFFSTLQSLYLHEGDERWSIMDWSDYHFNRHGHGPVRSFSLTSFLQQGTAKILKHWNHPISLLENFKINYSIKHFYYELEKKLAEDLEPPTAFIEKLKELIQNAESEEIKMVIGSKLSVAKIEELIVAIDKAYTETEKLSDIFEKKILQNVEEEKALGIFTTLPKDYFIEEQAVHLSGLSDFGQHLAYGENRSVIESLKEHYVSSESLESFFTNTLPQVLNQVSQDELIVFVGRTYHLTSLCFSWQTSENIFNPQIKFGGWESPRELLKISYHGKEHLIHLIEADQLKQNFLLVATKDSLKINFNKVKIGTSNYSYIKENNSSYEFIHYAECPQEIERLVTNNGYAFAKETKEDKEYELKGVIGFKYYISPSAEISKPDAIKIFQLPKPKEKDR